MKNIIEMDIESLLNTSPMKTDISLQSKFKHTLWLLIEQNICRYLVVNKKGSEDGALKAHHHLEICSLIIAAFTSTKIEDIESQSILFNFRSETTKLTSNLNKEIGFPLGNEYPNYDKLGAKFFDKIFEIAINYFGE